MKLCNVPHWKLERFLYIHDHPNKDRGYGLADQYCIPRQEVWRMRRPKDHRQWEKDALIDRQHEEALEMDAARK